MLMAAGKARQRQIEKAMRVLEDQAPMFLARVKILAGDQAARRRARASRSSTS